MSETPNPHGIEPDDALREIDGMEPPSHAQAEDFMGSVFRELTGWADIDSSPKALAKQREESIAAVRRQEAIFRDTFSTPAGRQCLQLLRDMTIEVSAYPPEANLPIDAITALVIAHDAQCNFVRAIEAAVGRSDKREGDRHAEVARQVPFRRGRRRWWRWWG